MTVIVPEGYVNCTVVWDGGVGTRQQTTSFGVAQRLGLITPGELDDLADAVVADMNLGIFNPLYLTTGWTLRKVVFSLGTATDPIIIERVLEIDGAFFASILPMNVAWIARKRTGFGGRRNRGRMYFPACVLLDEEQVSQLGVIDEVLVGTMQTNLESWLGAVSTSDYQLVLFHSNGGVPTPITSMEAENIVATQRRRLRR